MKSFGAALNLCNVSIGLAPTMLGSGKYVPPVGMARLPNHQRREAGGQRQRRHYTATYNARLLTGSDRDGCLWIALDGNPASHLCCRKREQADRSGTCGESIAFTGGAPPPTAAATAQNWPKAVTDFNRPPSALHIFPCDSAIPNRDNRGYDGRMFSVRPRAIPPRPFMSKAPCRGHLVVHLKRVRLNRYYACSHLHRWQCANPATSAEARRRLPHLDTDAAGNMGSCKPANGCAI